MTQPVHARIIFRATAPVTGARPAALPLPCRSTLALAVCALFGGGPAWADCTAAPSASTPDPATRILAPASGDTVNCSGTSTLSVSSLVSTGSPAVFSNNTMGVTVNNTGTLTPDPRRVAIALGAGTQIVNDGVITADSQSENLGAIPLWGAGNRIVNRGTISALNSKAIEGVLESPSWQLATGVVLENSGVISSRSGTFLPGTGAIALGDGAIVTNSGQIRLLNSDGAVALRVGDGSRIENQASGLIRAEEIVGTPSQAAGVAAVRSDGTATVVNAGRIEVIGDVNGPGRGVAVLFTGGGTIENTGTIDASRGSIAISAQAPISVVNAGTIRGGTGNAINLTNGDGSVVTLQTGSQITGTVSVRRRDSVLKTLQDWQAQFPSAPDQASRAFNACQQSTNSGCFKSVSALPNQATLVLEGSGSEDDRVTGFNVIEKRDAAAWALSTSLQAGSATDSYQSGDFRGPLRVNVADAAGQLGLSGSITDAADGTKGQLVKDGAGILALSGNNTYSGTTAINAGTLQANGGNALGDNSAVTVAAGATLALGAIETIGSLAGGGNVLLDTHTLRTGEDNASTTFAGSIDGTGALVKIGSGTLRLSGTSTSTGLLSVVGGILDMAGTTAMRALTQPAGTLIGTGIVGGLSNAGRVVPGNAGVGTLTVTGNYDQDAAGVLVINAAEGVSGLTASRLNVGGRAGFSSQPGTIDVKFDANAAIPALAGITVVAADQGLAGNAPRVVLDPASLPNGQNFTLDLEATNLGGTFAKPGEAIPAGAGGAGFVVLQVRNSVPTQQVITAQYTVINGPLVVPPTPVIVTPPQAAVLVPPLAPNLVPALAPVLVKGPDSTVVTPVIAPQPGQTTPPPTGILVQGGGVQLGGGTLVPTPATPGTVPLGTANPVVTVAPPADLGTSNFVSMTGSYGTHGGPDQCPAGRDLSSRLHAAPGERVLDAYELRQPGSVRRRP
jgi:autotransporter-associated beta strand protein